MKPASGLVFILLLVSCLHTDLIALYPSRRTGFQVSSDSPRGIILLERVGKPALLKTEEQERFYGSVGQDSTKRISRARITRTRGASTSLFSNFLKFNLTKVAKLEIAVDYERRVAGKWSFEVEAGYQFAMADRMGDDFFLGLVPLYKFSGVNLVAGPRVYLGKIYYLQLAGIYSYLEMDVSRTKFSVPGDSYGKLYQYCNDLGGALRIGIMAGIGRSGVLEAYIGIGLKACFINQFLYGTYPYDDSGNYFHWVNADHSPENNHITLLKPVINAGVKIGVGIK